MKRFYGILFLSVFYVQSLFAQFGPEHIISVSAAASQNAVIPGSSFNLAVVVDIEEELHINAHQPNGDFYIPTVVTLDSLPNVTFGEPVYPAAEQKTFSFSPDEKLAVYEDKIVIVVPVTTTAALETGTMTVSGQVSYQGCNDTMCFPPGEEAFEIGVEIVPAGTPVEPVNPELFENIEPAESVAPDNGGGIATLTGDEQRAREIIEKGLLYAVIAFFGIGLALNLTPCVYPVIPLTVSYFGGQSGKSRGSAFASAFMYQIGIAIAFALLGLISGLAGKQWGFLFQSPWFVVVIATIILAMAASLFGAFEISVPNWLMNKVGKSREGVVGALIMGLTVGVVIAPCAAGIIIGLVGLVAKLGLVVKGTLLFFVMGLGLGLPYLVLATFSGLLNKLPQSGMWMIWVRKLFAILLIGVAFYFLMPQLERIYNKFGFMAGLLGIFGGLLLGFLDHAPGYTKTFKVFRGIVGVALIVLGLVWTHGAIQSRPSEIEWVKLHDSNIEPYLQDDKPVFIDFYADWCAPCKQLDRVTFRDDDVVQAAKSAHMLKVDCTAPSEEIRSVMERFDVTGMPTLVYIAPGGQVRDDLREIGYIGPEEFLQNLQATAGK